jgi:hypothetical protein
MKCYFCSQELPDNRVMKCTNHSLVYFYYAYQPTYNKYSQIRLIDIYSGTSVNEGYAVTIYPLENKSELYDNVNHKTILKINKSLDFITPANINRSIESLLKLTSFS